jgi:hypothetical protein
MRQRPIVASLRLEASVAGFLYLLVIVLGVFAESASGKGWSRPAIRQPLRGRSWRTGPLPPGLRRRNDDERLRHSRDLDPISAT